MNTQDLERFDLGAPSYHYTARIIAESALRERILKAAQNRAVAPTDTLDPEQLYTWSALISNSTLDSWNTKMAESSLVNYAADAKEGVAFMNSHRHMELPVGYSVDGAYEGAQAAQGASDAGSYPRTMADFYTVRGVNLNGLPTDEFIKGVQYGLVRDVSIGFKEGEGFSMTCSICGLDWFDWDCYHIPGETYEVVTNPDADPSAQNTQAVLAFSWVNNARLSEVSAVYDGATPNAGITKLMREARGGRLKPDVLRMLESKYRIHLPEAPKLFRGYSNDNKGENNMNGEKPAGTGTSGAPDPGEERVSDKVRAFGRSLGIKDVQILDTTTPDAVIETVRAEIQRLQALEPRAIEGEKLRKALIEDAVKEGNRAFGAEFKAEAKQRMLEALDADSIAEMRDSWSMLGDAKFAEMKVRSSAEQVDAEGEKEGEGKAGEKDPDANSDTPLPITEDTEGGV